jgi:protein MpaA
VLLADAPAPPPIARPAATVEDGRSVEGRRLRVARRGAPDAPRRVLVIGSMHGDEPGGRRVVAALRQERAPQGVAIFTVADLDPDGSRLGRRGNAHGVDLNRNFPGDWRSGPRGRFYPGPRAGSEPETRWLRRVVRAVRPQVTVWFHQPYGLVELTRGADHALVRAYARRVRLPARSLPRYRGTATGWQNGSFPGTSAFVVELRPGRPTDAEVRRHVRAVHALR